MKSIFKKLKTWWNSNPNLYTEVSDRTHYEQISEMSHYQYQIDKNDPNRRIYTIDVSNIKPADIESYMKTVRDNIIKTPFIDEKTGEYNITQLSGSRWTEEWFLPNRPKETE